MEISSETTAKVPNGYLMLSFTATVYTAHVFLSKYKMANSFLQKAMNVFMFVKSF